MDERIKWILFYPLNTVTYKHQTFHQRPHLPIKIIHYNKALQKNQFQQGFATGFELRKRSPLPVEPHNKKAVDNSSRIADRRSGGGEGNRTPVRKPLTMAFSEYSPPFRIPLAGRRQASFRLR